MPSSEEILVGLGRVANEWRFLAIAWHIVIAVGMAVCVAGWRPGRRLAGLLIAMPLLSVSAVSLRATRSTRLFPRWSPGL